MGTVNKEHQDVTRNIMALVNLFLSYSHNISSIRCLGLPLESFPRGCTDRWLCIGSEVEGSMF